MTLPTISFNHDFRKEVDQDIKEKKTKKGKVERAGKK